MNIAIYLNRRSKTYKDAGGKMTDRNSFNIPSNPGSSVNSHTTIAGASTNGLIQSSMVTGILNKTPYDGKLDKHGEVRLRIGIIDNPMIKRTEEGRIDPINPYNVINMTTGNITIRWLEQDGGLVRPPEFGEYGQDGEGSDREPLTLTHPMIWANESNNWCGINYMPPVGSVVIVGFRKHNLPVLLGFLQSHYQVTYPLELGEIMNKGFGHNTSHWKMNDEQEHKAWVIKGDSKPVAVLDAPGRKYRWENAPYTVKLKLRLKAWIDPKSPNDNKEMIEMTATRVKDSGIEESVIELRPEKITLSVGNGQSIASSIVIEKDVNINTTGNMTLSASKTLTLVGNKIDINP
ncbi:MAG: hypothetical protein K0R18_113 [Bacillales bacterium]|jgi:hypothetical protein|nr:hypothetical protein [Bacillales bacterium]